jgi:hypothetical protein
MNIRSSSPVATCDVCGPITWIVTEDSDGTAQRLCCGECGREVTDRPAAGPSNGAPPTYQENLTAFPGEVDPVHRRKFVEIEGGS